MHRAREMIMHGVGYTPAGFASDGAAASVALAGAAACVDSAANMLSTGIHSVNPVLQTREPVCREPDATIPGR